MHEKQRIKDCIEFRQTDKIPWQIDCTTELAENVMKSLSIDEQDYSVLGKNVLAYSRLNEFFGNHISIIRTRPVNAMKEAESGIWKDEWNVLWDRRIDKDIGVPIDYLLKDMRIEHLRAPDPLDPNRYVHFQPIIEANSHRYLLAKFSYGLFERAWSLRGMENLLMDFIDNPSFVHELFEFITEFHIKILKNLIDYAIEGVLFSDDWGGQRGLFMSPDTWAKFLKPYLKKTYDQAHRQGYDVFIHSCGNICSILDELVEMGVDVFNPFQPDVIDVEEVIGEYSHRLAFWWAECSKNTSVWHTRGGSSRGGKPIRPCSYTWRIHHFTSP